jgi:hypothetical protein
LRLIVDTLEQLGERIGLEAFAVQQVILEQLTRLIGLGEGLRRYRRMRALRQFFQSFAQCVGQVSHVASMLDRLAVGMGTRVRMARRRWLFLCGHCRGAG